MFQTFYWPDGSPCLDDDPRALWRMKQEKIADREAIEFAMRDVPLLRLEMPFATWQMNRDRQYRFTRRILSSLSERFYTPFHRGEKLKATTWPERRRMIAAAFEATEWQFPPKPVPASAFKTIAMAQPALPPAAPLAKSDPTLVRILDKLADVVSRPVEVDLKGATTNAATVEDLESLFLAIVREFKKVAPDKRDLEIAWPDGKKTTIEHLSGGDVAIRFPDGRRTTLRRRN